MVSAALLIFENYPFHHCRKPLRKFCVLFATTDFALHLKKNGGVLPEKKKMASYKQVWFVSSALPVYRNVI